MATTIRLSEQQPKHDSTATVPEPVSPVTKATAHKSAYLDNNPQCHVVTVNSRALALIQLMVKRDNSHGPANADDYS